MSAMPRQFYTPRTATLTIDQPEKGIQVFEYQTGTRPAAIAFAGKAMKPAWHYSFHSPTERTQKINLWLQSLEAWETAKEQRRQAARQDIDAVKVGDIYYHTWGYDQTNVNFYQVTSRTASTFTVRELRQDVKETGFMCGQAVPLRDDFLEKSAPELHRNLNRLSSWDGRPVYCSWYA
jgi:hypothetical protein